MKDVAAQQWDVIVIGTGIGGGTLGRALAEAGKRVLFLEKGPAGPRREETPLDPAMFEPTGRAVRGFWPAPVRARVDGREQRFFAPLGAGVGGSSVFYAATLERPERHDIEDSPARPHPTGGWALSYDGLLPQFDAAERLYRVCGTPDPLSSEPAGPLRPPPPLSPTDARFHADLTASGLHPYRQHSAIAYLDGCASCLGRKCPRPCKMDGRSAGVEPALATGRAALIDRAEVTGLSHDGDRITGVTFARDGETVTCQAAHVVLSAGALSSPRLWMASDLPDASGLVGRNLMFHLNEMVALWPRGRSGGTGAPAGASKALSLRDLYHLDGQRFGTVQAMGIDIGYGEIVHYLGLQVARGPLARMPGKGLALRAAAALGARLFGTAHVFVGLLEDLPYAENRVLPGPGIAIDYTIHPELRTRRSAFRRALRRAFRGHRKWFLNFQPELNFGHPCGTLRLGDDPARSVVTPEGRAHGLENLWVADASVFPTSMGVNPSLTIAALALRTGDALIARLEEEP
jgi:choline dehydrogenase-like flavoprotein